MNARAWKPHASAYVETLEECGVRAADAMLVAVHPWDIHGAARVGLRTGWVDAAGKRYPPYFRVREVTAPGLDALAVLASRGLSVRSSPARAPAGPARALLRRSALMLGNLVVTAPAVRCMPAGGLRPDLRVGAGHPGPSGPRPSRSGTTEGRGGRPR